MQADVLKIAELLKDCTAKLKSKSGNATKTGTAFFVSPDKLLTCLHVIAGANLEIEWRGNTFIPQTVETDPHKRDLALLSISSLPDHPCCLLADEYPHIGEELIAYGYTESYPLGDSGSYLCEGISNHGTDGPLLKVKAGQAFPGMSGGPLVRLQAGKVCGVMATERLNTAMGGGRAVPVDTAYLIWPTLKALQKENESCTERWKQVFRTTEADDSKTAPKLEDGIEFNIPDHWTFRDVASVMAQVGKSVCDFQGFKPKELNAEIKSRTVSAKSLSEALEQLRLMTIGTGMIRPYEVNRKGAMYLLSVI